MDSENAILEISSDDEDDRQGSMDWFVDMIKGVEGEDTEDVVVVGEFSCFTAIQNRNLSNSIADSVDVLDDDCLILEGDPDELATAADDREAGSDDLLIVAEKGLVACRDFPHSRHLCVKFPFSSTPHVNHCELCHCYVCDEHAPCFYWGTGDLPNDHCHSTDKEERWKTERKQMKLGTLPSPACQKFPDTILSITPPLHSFEPSLPLAQSPNLDPIMLLPPVSRTNQIHSLPSNTYIMPNVISRNRHNRHHRFVPSRISVPQPAAHSIQGKAGGNLRPPLFVAHPQRFKKAGGASSVINRSGFDSSGKNQVYPGAQASSDGINQNMWHDFLMNDNSEMIAVQNFSQPNNSSLTDPPPSQPLPYYVTSGFPSSAVTSQIPTNFQAQPVIGKSDQSLLQLTSNTNMPAIDNPVFLGCNSILEDLSWINASSLSSLSQTLEEPQPPIDQLPESPFVTVAEATTVSSLALHLQNWPSDHDPNPGPTNDQVLSEIDYYMQSPVHSFVYNFESTWSGLADV